MINKQTTLDLNGPILSFTQQPSSVTVNDTGNATFVGLATATFPTQDPSNPSTNTGTISYRWYDQNGPLSDGSNVSGSTTRTLTLTNLRSPGDNGRRVYLKADYIPSAYGLTGVAVTVGSARSTGNAANDTLNSNTAVITVNSIISITRQPSSSTVTQDQSATFVVSAQLSDGSQSGLSYNWLLNGSLLQNSSTVSGATTPTLTISSSAVGTYTIQARITHPTASNSPLLSQSVQFGVIPSPISINTETITSSTTTASLASYNLATNNNITLLGRNYTDSSTLISLYAPNRDVDVEMDIYGGKGANYGSFQGGQGGYSKIRFTMKRNEEYVISGLNVVDNCPYVYRKGKLIAVVGTGGNASTNGNGGAGGGIGLSGGSSSAGIPGGVALSPGQLTTNGVFGSTSSSTPIPPDTKASGTLGGRTTSCSKGTYWTSRGFSPCSDIGSQKLFLPDGREVTNSAQIDRGFKPGYSIKQTAGAGAPATTTTQLVPRTCTRLIPSTCYRQTSQFVSQTVTVTDERGGISLNYTPDNTYSFLVGRYNDGAFGTEGNRPGIIGYYIIFNFLSDPNVFSASILDTSTRASGLIASDSSIRLMSGYPTLAPGDPLGRIRFAVAFDMTSSTGTWGGRQATYARRWSFSFTGSKTFQEAYDCSFNESYDCSYFATVPVGGGGHGGNGATGGQGGQASFGGGGGSGYTDGSVTVVSSTVGGSNEARIDIKSITIPTTTVSTNWVRFIRSGPSSIFGNAPYGVTYFGTPIISGDNIAFSGYIVASTSGYYTFQSLLNKDGEILNLLWDPDYISLQNSGPVGSFGTLSSGNYIMSSGRYLFQRSTSTFNITKAVSLSNPCNVSLVSDTSGNVYGSSLTTNGITVSSLTSNLQNRWSVSISGAIINSMDILPNGNLIAGGVGGSSQAQWSIISPSNGSIISSYLGYSGGIGAITSDSSGNVYTAGVNSGTNYIVISKFNSSGTRIWENNINFLRRGSSTFTSIGPIYSIAVDSNSNSFILSGRYLIKYNSSGIFQWIVGLFGVGSSTARFGNYLKIIDSSIYVTLGTSVIKLSTTVPPQEGTYGPLTIESGYDVFPGVITSNWTSTSSVATSSITNTITDVTRTFQTYTPLRNAITGAEDGTTLTSIPS